MVQARGTLSVNTPLTSNDGCWFQEDGVPACSTFADGNLNVWTSGDWLPVTVS